MMRELVIETTRRCNMSCDHCMRGAAQNLDFDCEHLVNFLNKYDITYINTLTLSGGEPSIAVPVLREILHTLKEMDVEIGNFYIATNGKHITPEFIGAVVAYYAYCSSNEVSNVRLSGDSYHEKGSFESIMMLKVLKICSVRPEIEDYNIVNEGNAEFYGIGSREAVIEVDHIYLNCLGQTMHQCDLSYDNQYDAEVFVGEINTEEAEEFLKRYRENIPCRELVA